jgi:hypothetical protein
MSNKKVPEWLNQYVRDMLVVLNISNPEWRVFTKMGKFENEDTTAAVNVDPVYMNATITFRTDLKPGEDTKQAVLHEGIHIIHDPVDLIMRRVLRTVPKSRRKVLSTLYDDAIENFVQRLSRALMAYFISKNYHYEQEINELKAEIQRLSAANNDQEWAGAVDRPELTNSLRELPARSNGGGQGQPRPELLPQCNDPDIGD